MDKDLISKEFSSIYKIIFDSARKMFPLIEEKLIQRISMILSVLLEHMQKRDNLSNPGAVAKIYLNNIKQFVNGHKSLDSLESWFELVIAAMGNNISGDKEIDSHDTENVIVDSMILEIQRLISSDIAPGMLNMMRKIIKNFLYSKKKLNLDMLKYILERLDTVAVDIKKQYQKSISQRFVSLTKKNEEKIFAKVIRSALSSIQKEVVTKKFGKLSFFVSVFQSLEKLLVARKFLHYLKNAKQKKIIKKQSKSNRVKGSDELYNMLHGHNPNRFVEISSAISNNSKLKEEVTRLRSQGLEKNEAGYEGMNRFQKNLKAQNKKDYSPSK